MAGKLFGPCSPSWRRPANRVMRPEAPHSPRHHVSLYRLRHTAGSDWRLEVGDWKLALGDRKEWTTYMVAESEEPGDLARSEAG